MSNTNDIEINVSKSYLDVSIARISYLGSFFLTMHVQKKIDDLYIPTIYQATLHFLCNSKFPKNKY